MVCRLCQIWPKYHYDTLMGILKASVEFSAPGGQLGICWVSPCTLVSPTVQMYNWVSPAQRGAVHQTPHVSSPPFRPFAQTNKRSGCDSATIVPTQFLNPMEKGLRCDFGCNFGCDFATIVPTQFLNPMEKGLI